jgi:hypothetical protein
MKGAVVSIVFAIIGLILAFAMLVIKPLELTFTILVLTALFIMALTSLANYKFHANRHKMFHRFVIAIETVAAVAVIIEMTFSAGSKNVPYDYVVFFSFILFELYLGYDAWRYTHTKT